MPALTSGVRKAGKVRRWVRIRGRHDCSADHGRCRCKAESPLWYVFAPHPVLALLGRSFVVLVIAVLTVGVTLPNATARPRASVTPPPVSVPNPIGQPTRTTKLPRQVPTPPEIATTQSPASTQVAPVGARRNGILSTINLQKPRIRPPAADREVARRVAVLGGVLVLPTIAYFGVPVILDVPELGYVGIPEDRYAELYDKLSSDDPEQVQEAIAALREIKAAEDAQIEALRHRAVKVVPTDSDVNADVPAVAERDLSEPISFGPSYPRFQSRRHQSGSRRLY